MQGAGRAFKGLGDDAAKALKNWWKGGPDIEKILELKPLRDIPDEVHKAKLYASELADEVTKKMDVAAEGIRREVGRRESLVRDISTKVDMSTRKLNTMIETSRNPTKWYPGLEENIKNQKEYLEVLVTRQADIAADLKILQNIDKGIATNPQGVVSQLERAPELMSRFTSLGRWQQAAAKQMTTKNQILKSTSRYIGSDRKFVKEYLKEIAKLPEGNLYKMTWLANPQNQVKLLRLQTNKRYMKKLLDIGKGGVAARESLKGLSASQIAKKLGVAGGVTVGAIAFYSWFDDNGDEIVEQAQDINTMLGTIRTTGAGTVIVKDVKNAIEKIQKAKAKAETGLGTNPAKAAPEFIKEFTEAQQTIDNALYRWDAVVQTSNNPDEAKRVGEALRQYSANTTGTLEELNKSIVTKPQPTAPGLAGEKPVHAPVSKENILRIQRYLQETNPSVGASGELDRPTVRALKQLEREYDRLGEVSTFSEKHLLVNREIGHVISIEDLKDIESMMEKYR